MDGADDGQQRFLVMLLALVLALALRSGSKQLGRGLDVCSGDVQEKGDKEMVSERRRGEEYLAVFIPDGADYHL